MRHRDFTVGEVSLTLWTACDLDPLLDQLMNRAEDDPDLVDERMPYWAELWPSSLLMAEVMSRHHPRLPAGPFLEMGCGPALPSIMAAKLGRGGWATDYLQEARWLAEVNLSSNQVLDRVQVHHLDWRTPLDRQFPWILAGDVSYEARNFDPLLQCWDQMLQPDGEVWLAEPGRSVAKPFFDLLREQNWTVEVIGEKERIRVHRIRRPPDKGDP